MLLLTLRHFIHTRMSCFKMQSKTVSKKSNNIYLLRWNLTCTWDTQTGSASCTFHQGSKSLSAVEDPVEMLLSTALLAARSVLMLLWKAGRFSARSLVKSPERYKWNCGGVSFKPVLAIDHWGNCTRMFVIGPHWSYVNIGSGQGLVPPGNKPWSEPMLTKI